MATINDGNRIKSLHGMLATRLVSAAKLFRATRLQSLTYAAAIKIAANVGRNWKHKVAGPGVGKIQVWINDKMKLEQGSHYTDRGLTSFDFGSKKIMAIQVSSFVTNAEHSQAQCLSLLLHDSLDERFLQTSPITQSAGESTKSGGEG
jgi:hypothetical protein